MDLMTAEMVYYSQHCCVSDCRKTNTHETTGGKRIDQTVRQDHCPVLPLK